MLKVAVKKPSTKKTLANCQKLRSSHVVLSVPNCQKLRSSHVVLSVTVIPLEYCHPSLKSNIV